MTNRDSQQINPGITTKLIVSKDSFKTKLRERIKIGEEILNRQIETDKQFENALNDFGVWSDYNSELLKQSFNVENNEYKEAYDFINLSEEEEPFGSSSFHDDIIDFREDVRMELVNLNQLVSKVELLKTSIMEKDYLAETSSKKTNLKDVFIVHGHNNEVKTEVARTLEKLELIPIILHEQPNQGKTIIEKFESHSNVGFAIVLMTDDDYGKAKTDNDLSERARQNVILELGYFIGKLGRSKVCPLYTRGVELPSDLHGLLYVEIDQSESWKMRLVKELKAAGYNVDANKVI